MIERVEHFPPEYSLHAFPDLEVAMDTDIKAEIARAYENEVSGVAKGELWLYYEGARIEPTGDGSLI